MQALWSRAQRPITSSCRCKWCLSSSSSALRKSIIGGGNGHLQLKHLTTTLFYSSLIATAAAVDVKVKRKRREHWDRAIAEVESSLHNTPNPSQSPDIEERQSSRISFRAEDTDVGPFGEEGAWARHFPDTEWLSSTANGSSDSNRRQLRSILSRHAESKPEYQTNGSPGTLSNGSELDPTKYLDDGFHDTRLMNELISEVLSGLDSGRGSEPDPFILMNPGPQSVYASKHLRSKHVEETFVPKKTLRLELTTAQLATRLLFHTTPSYGDYEGPRSRSSLKTTLADINAKLLELRNRETFDVGDIGRLHYPQYHDTSPAFIEEQSAKLNSSLDDLSSRLADVGYRKRRDIVAKIAYNLLISPVPPNTATYAMLLSRLSQADEAKLADEVATAFFASRRRANETIVHSVLEHCRKHYQDKNFDVVVQKLHGFHGGLNLGWGSSDRLAPYLRKVDGKMYQTVLPDRWIFHSMIAGYLEQGNLEEGLQAFRWMRAESVEPDLTTYNIFLEHFSQKRHWERGYGIWEKAKALLAQHDRLDLSRPGPAHKAYGLALKLCERCMKDDEYRVILEDAQEQGFEQIGEHDSRHGYPSLDELRPSQRSLRILERRLEFVRRDIERLWIQVLSSKVLLSGQPLNEIRKAFLRHADEPAYQEWLRERMHHGKRRQSYKQIPVEDFIEPKGPVPDNDISSTSRIREPNAASLEEDLPAPESHTEVRAQEAPSKSKPDLMAIHNSTESTNAAIGDGALKGTSQDLQHLADRLPERQSNNSTSLALRPNVRNKTQLHGEDREPDFVRAWRESVGETRGERLAGMG